MGNVGWASVRDVTCKNVVERWLQKLHSWRAVLEIGT
jgi:hypothetical protein